MTETTPIDIAGTTVLVTLDCQADGCKRPVTSILVGPRRQPVADRSALCDEDTTRFTADHPDLRPTLVPVAPGTHGLGRDGAQVGTCRHCCHRIYLYPVMVRVENPWRAHEFDETGRCTPYVEGRARQPVAHEPATTVAELHAAYTAALCARPEDHLPENCVPHKL
jgi:hypothetical protein